MQARLAATDIACRRGQRLLLRGFRCALEPGTALHLAGPNGIGKTSLLRILAGLLRPWTGSVERSGAVAMIDERHALDGQADLRTALTWWSQLDGSVDTVERHMEQLGLTELADVPVRYLSTGQRKRAALVRLLGQGAPIWLLDEPLNGLDAKGGALAEALVAEHCAAGGVAAIASHQAFGGTTHTLDLAGYSA